MSKPITRYMGSPGCVGHKRFQIANDSEDTPMTMPNWDTKAGGKAPKPKNHERLGRVAKLQGAPGEKEATKTRPWTERENNKSEFWDHDLGGGGNKKGSKFFLKIRGRGGDPQKKTNGERLGDRAKTRDRGQKVRKLGGGQKSYM